MTFQYPTTYTDQFGKEETAFVSDGVSLTISIRGVRFEGHFWELRLIDADSELIRQQFELIDGLDVEGNPTQILANFSLWVKIPIKVVTLDGEELDALVEVDKRAQTQLYFLIGGRGAKFKRNNFEQGLSKEFTKPFQIQHVKCCLNCKFSEYSPFGHEPFGDLMCFKNCKTEWANIGYHGLYSAENWSNLLGRIYVQETYRCEEFEAKA